MSRINRNSYIPSQPRCFSSVHCNGCKSHTVRQTFHFRSNSPSAEHLMHEILFCILFIWVYYTTIIFTIQSFSGFSEFSHVTIVTFHRWGRAEGIPVLTACICRSLRNSLFSGLLRCSENLCCLSRQASSRIF